MVRIVDAFDEELGAGRHVEADANQAAGQQKLVGGSCFAERVRRRALAVGAVVVGEDWIGAARLVEPLLQVRRRDGPRGIRLMARHATPSIRTEILEEGVVQVQRAVDVQCLRVPARVRKVEDSWIGIGCRGGQADCGKHARDHRGAQYERETHETPIQHDSSSANPPWFVLTL